MFFGDWFWISSKKGIRSKSICIDSCITLNSSDISCGEYASHTLTGRQASSMAKTTAIALCPWFAFLGRKFGWQRYFVSLIRILGEKTRTRDVSSATHPDFWGDFPDECRSSIHLGKIMGKKWPRCIEKQVQNIVFGYRLVIKQAKYGQGVSRHASKLAQIRMLPDAQSQQAEVRMFYDMLYQ